MSKEIMESPRAILDSANVMGLKTTHEMNLVRARFTEKRSLLTSYIEHLLRKSGRVDFTLQELHAAFDITFAELVEEILVAGESDRGPDWEIEDVVCIGCEILAALPEAGLHTLEDLDDLDDFEYKHLI